MRLSVLSTLDGLPEARRREFLDEFERDLPKNDPAPRNAPVEDASEINVDWERRVQFDALRDGNALRQNDVLNRATATLPCREEPAEMSVRNVNWPKTATKKERQ